MHVRDLVPKGADLDDGLGVAFQTWRRDPRDRGAPWLRRDGASTVEGPCAQLGDESVADLASGSTAIAMVGCRHRVGLTVETLREAP